MNISRLLVLLATSIFLCSCSRGLPPLRTWDVANAKKDVSIIEFSFIAPIRDPSKGYWPYLFGIALPKGTVFDLAGQVTVYSESGSLKNSFRFSSATTSESSWLRNPDKVSHLITDGSKNYYNNFGIEDGKVHRVKIVFDRPLTTEVGVVLHFLSHTNSPPQIIK
jgi:hypothetical protein